MKTTLKKVWSLFSKDEKHKAILMLLAALVMAIFEALGVLSIMPFLSVLSRPEIIQENFVLRSIYETGQFSSEKNFIIALGLGSIAMVLTSSFFKTITQHSLNRFVHLQRHAISSRLMSRYLHQPYEFFLGRNTAELSKNVLSETDQLIFSLIQPLSQLLVQGVIVCMMALIILAYDPQTALIALAVVGTLYFLIYSLVRRRLGLIGKEVVAANKERYLSCNEALSGIRDIKMTDSADAYLARYKHASRNHARHFATNDTLSQTPLYLAEATGYTGLILISLYLLTNSSDFSKVLPALGLYGFAAYRLLPAAQIMYRGFAKLRFTSAALDNIYNDFTIPVVEPTVSSNILVPSKEIRLKNVSFAYPLEPNKKIFHNYNLSIPANSITGISGKSGAGKSTLMDLLLGLIQPQEGSLLIDDVQVDFSNIKAWHNAIGYVPQHIYLADASVISNIAFGLATADIDIQAVELAAKAAQIHEFILNELPNGYATILGDRGIRLSGGQRQRIGIARALYKDPPILFMDEATSALDEETETQLNETLVNMSLSKTIILITHRSSTLKKCTVSVDVSSNRINV